MLLHQFDVAPLAGAWIEIFASVYCCSLLNVAPLAGAWIEINKESLDLFEYHVAPLAGAWIEICIRTWFSWAGVCRSPRGSVD